MLRTRGRHSVAPKKSGFTCIEPGFTLYLSIQTKQNAMNYFNSPQDAVVKFANSTQKKSVEKMLSHMSINRPVVLQSQGGTFLLNTCVIGGVTKYGIEGAFAHVCGALMEY